MQMETNNENSNVVKKRHGLLTIVLVIFIVVNIIVAISLFLTYFILSNNANANHKQILDIAILDGILSIVNVFLLILLTQWKKIGFWGLIFTSLTTFILNFSNGIEIMQDIYGLIGIAILFAVLQIKKDNVSAWENLK